MWTRATAAGSTPATLAHAAFRCNATQLEKEMKYIQTGSYCEPCLYFASCPVHDPDGSIWRAAHPGQPYFDNNGEEKIA